MNQWTTQFLRYSNHLKILNILNILFYILIYFSQKRHYFNIFFFHCTTCIITFNYSNKLRSWTQAILSAKTSFFPGSIYEHFNDNKKFVISESYYLPIFPSSSSFSFDEEDVKSIVLFNVLSNTNYPFFVLMSHEEWGALMVFSPARAELTRRWQKTFATFSFTRLPFNLLLG